MIGASRRPAGIVALLLTLLTGILLGGCSVNRPLLSDIQADPPLLQPTGAGETTIISYRIGREAVLDIYLESADGQRYDLRRAVPRSPDDAPYTLRFDGTVPVDPAHNDGLLRRLLPDGDYTVVLVAQANDGSTSAARTVIAVRSDAPPLPTIENLRAFPETISPNADAIDDVTEITYRLPVTATVDIAITTPDGQVLPFVTRELSSPEERRHVWNGKRPDGAMLPDGVYTYTVRAEDRFGNLVQREDTIRLINVGQPEATIIAARIAPERLMLGGTLTVEMRIRNTGDVPIRTYGPPSGFSYTTDESIRRLPMGVTPPKQAASGAWAWIGTRIRAVAHVATRSAGPSPNVRRNSGASPTRKIGSCPARRLRWWGMSKWCSPKPACTSTSA